MLAGEKEGEREREEVGKSSKQKERKCVARTTVTCHVFIAVSVGSKEVPGSEHVIRDSADHGNRHFYSRLLVIIQNKSSAP